MPYPIAFIIRKMVKYEKKRKITERMKQCETLNYVNNLNSSNYNMYSVEKPH